MVDRTGAEIVKAIRDTIAYAFRERHAEGEIRIQKRWDEYRRERLEGILQPVLESAESGEFQPKARPSPDWEHMFCSTAPNSDEGISDLWSRILAGELENPGSVPKKLMRTLETLTREEAETFISICRFTALVPEMPRLMVFTEPEFREVFTPPNHLARTELEATGLIRHTQNEFIAVQGKLIVAHYYGSEASRISQSEMGDWHFTKEGVALYRVAQSSITPDEQFRSWLLDEWPLIGPGGVKEPTVVA